MEHNPNGFDHWPWYGMSFITQGFIGGRACADMLYSGHIFMLTLMVMTGAATYRPGESKLMFWLFSTALIVVGGGFLVQCQDHYTADVVLGLGIAVTLGRMNVDFVS